MLNFKKFIEAFHVSGILPAPIGDNNDCIFCGMPHHNHRFIEGIHNHRSANICVTCNEHLLRLEGEEYLFKYVEGHRIETYLTGFEGTVGWSFTVEFIDVNYTYDDFNEGDGVLYPSDRIALLAGIAYYLSIEKYENG